jgi:hypothetical protein
MLRAIATEDKGHVAAQRHTVHRASLTLSRFPGRQALGQRSTLSPAQHKPMRRKVPIPRLTTREYRGARAISAR